MGFQNQRTAPAIVPKPPRLSAAPRPPKALPQAVQSRMGKALGMNFADVRVHAEPTEAVQLQARAFTRGEDLYFAPGRYQPATPAGRRLIGHELTHVAQQRSGNVAPTGLMGQTPINDHPNLEAEADRLAGFAEQLPPTMAGSAIHSGRSGHPLQSSAETAAGKRPGGVVQRMIGRTAYRRCWSASTKSTISRQNGGNFGKTPRWNER